MQHDTRTLLQWMRKNKKENVKKQSKVSNIQKCQICEVYICASQAYNAGSRKTSHVDVTSEPAT